MDQQNNMPPNPPQPDGYPPQPGYPPPPQPSYQQPPPQAGYPPPQPGYPPPGQPQYAYTPPPTAAGSGMSPGLAVVLAYLIGIIGPIVVLAVEKQNKFVRFHALQALLSQAAIIALSIALSFVSFFVAAITHGLGFILFSCLYPLVYLGVGVYFLVVMIQAATGKTMRVPVIADYADRLLPTFMV